MLISFILFMSCFALVGLSAAKFAQKSKDDYYLAGRSVSAWLTGLSAVATNNSGYMFIGVIGYTYHSGFAAIWLMFGWIVGDIVASFYIHRHVQSQAKKHNAVSVMSLVSLWQGKTHPVLRRLLAWAALILMMSYAAAQFLAGSKALHVLLDWPIWLGVVLVAILVAAYCFAGGIRASIWTDAAQSFVMVIAMGILLVTATNSQGGVSAVWQQLQQVPNFMNMQPEGLLIPGWAGVIAFTVGWFFAGFSVVGQPHVMVRFIALSGEQKMSTVRIWYYVWFTIFYLMATAVGMLSRLILDNSATFDAELALPLISVELLPGWLVGLILAGIFAATLSTADSLILSCSAAFTQDAFKQKILNTKIIKTATLVITLVTLLIALYAQQSVFSLVVFSWSAMGCAIAPLLIGFIRGWRISEWGAIFVVILSVGSSIVWRYFGLHNSVYEGVIGILLGVICFAMLNQSKKPEVTQ
ncbi:sodium/proline symporter [Catenovulum sp. 2E275]|uniref:sodium/proline symporter n=1 Tax=Catenovulum sp. 2E275 TaxID=2980497 RepID=UPI0021CF7B73|nr:sodium/proline symporter [Catenovulum sp. 2E275]MCU4674402.1 sodium/proline symporter [Catenovulum sp. 2E275]